MIALETLKSRSRSNMGNVHPEVEKKVDKLLTEAYERGLFVQISSGYRTYEEQAALYGKGRPGYTYKGKAYGRSGAIVTYAEPGESNHHSGRAVDFFLVTPDGRTALWTVDHNWRWVAERAKELGFSWGGDWSSFKDYAHLELPIVHYVRRGSQGSLVKDLQEKLRKLGYYTGDIDGSFGPLTEEAVIAFQRKEALQIDGSAGPETLTRLDVRTYPGRPVRKGARGDKVKAIQNKTGSEADGIFGSRTEAAVRSYQRARRLEVDGIVGPKTWRALFGM